MDIEAVGRGQEGRGGEVRQCASLIVTRLFIYGLQKDIIKMEGADGSCSWEDWCSMDEPIMDTIPVLILRDDKASLLYDIGDTPDIEWRSECVPVVRTYETESAVNKKIRIKNNFHISSFMDDTDGFHVHESILSIKMDK